MQQPGKADTTQKTKPQGKAPQSESTDSSGDVSSRLELVRDEIKLQLHLAGMEAKETWGGLEAQLEDALRAGNHKVEVVTQLASETRENAQGTLEDLLIRFQLFRDSLNKARGH